MNQDSCILLFVNYLSFFTLGILGNFNFRHFFEKPMIEFKNILLRKIQNND